MPDDTITLVSTTDSAEQVQEALTSKPAEKPAEKPADKPVEPAPERKPAETPAADPDAEPPADETAEQRETREASDAGRKLGERGAKRKKSIQDEIDDLTGKKYNVRRDVEAEEARLADLRRQRESLEASAPKPPAPPGAPPAADLAGRPEPKLDATDDDGVAKYATYEDFLSDHAVWSKEEAALAARKVLADERQADRERIDRESASRAVNERVAAYHAKVETFKKTHADFDAAVEDARGAVQQALVAMGPQAMRVIDGYTIFDAEDGPAVAYYLLKHPDELVGIAMKAPQQQVVHLARLEERIRSGGAKKTGPSPAAAPETKAPEPIKPVGSGPTATTVSSDEESYQDYRARRERELRKRQAR